MKEKRASGDLKGMKITDSTNLLAQEWKQLSASDRKVCGKSFNNNTKELTNPSDSRILQSRPSNDMLRNSRRYLIET
jgi:hypothetical protein